MTKRSQARLPDSIDFARHQRRNSNEFAATVWQWIRNRQILGAKFRREYPIPPYTVDFCCVELNLIIEIDGEGHFTDEGMEHDRARDRFLQSLGYKILRIPGYAVIREDGNVLATIREFVGEAKNPSPRSGARKNQALKKTLNSALLAKSIKCFFCSNVNMVPVKGRSGVTAFFEL